MLSDRFHICDCGVIQQRDLFSAFLARCVEGDRLVAGMVQANYPEIDFVLRTAASRNKSVIGQVLPANFLDGSQNGSSVYSVNLAKTSDGVSNTCIAESR